MYVLWMTIAASLVFMMTAGFLMVGAAVSNTRNTASIAQKTIAASLIGILTYSLVGYGIMFGGSENGFFGTNGLYAKLADPKTYANNLFYNLAFCSVTIGIVTCAIADKVSQTAVLIVAALMAAVIYPVMGHMIWGNTLIGSNAAFLATKGFVDHAGGVTIHALAGIMALVMAVMLKKKHQPKATTSAKTDSTVTALSGAMVLFVLWVPFNTGAMVPGNAAFAIAALGTVIAGAAGGVSGMALGYFLGRHAYVPMSAVLGLIGGLVATSSGIGYLDIIGAAAIGMIGGLTATGGQYVIRQILAVNDPAGIGATHGLAGIIGAIVFPFFASISLPAGNPMAQAAIQSTGAITAVLWGGITAIVMSGIFKIFGMKKKAKSDNYLGFSVNTPSPEKTRTRAKIAQASDSLKERSLIQEKNGAHNPKAPFAKSRFEQQPVGLVDLNDAPLESVARIDGKRILVIDSDAQKGRAVTDKINEYGSESLAVTSAQKAIAFLQKARSKHLDIHLVIAKPNAEGINQADFLDSLQSNQHGEDEIPVYYLQNNITENQLVADIAEAINSNKPISSNPSYTRQGRIDVLVVEDKKPHQDCIKLILDEFDVNYLMVGNAVEGVKAWNKHRPNLVLMDITLPEIDGYAACRRIRAIEQTEGTSPTPIVAMNTRYNRADHEKLDSAGLDSYISKPVKKSDIQSALQAFEIINPRRMTG